MFDTPVLGDQEEAKKVSFILTIKANPRAIFSMFFFSCMSKNYRQLKTRKNSKRSWKERPNVVFMERYQTNRFRRESDKGPQIALQAGVLGFICIQFLPRQASFFTRANVYCLKSFTLANGERCVCP